jgi:hypothetical protein
MRGLTNDSMPESADYDFGVRGGMSNPGDNDWRKYMTDYSMIEDRWMHDPGIPSPSDSLRRIRYKGDASGSHQIGLSHHV